MDSSNSNSRRVRAVAVAAPSVACRRVLRSCAHVLRSIPSCCGVLGCDAAEPARGAAAAAEAGASTHARAWLGRTGTRRICGKICVSNINRRLQLTAHIRSTASACAPAHFASQRYVSMAHLLTREDARFFRIHALCGLYALLHFLYRLVMWLKHRSFLFSGTFATPLSLVPHALLAASALQFRLPAKRNPSAPMLNPEARRGKDTQSHDVNVIAHDEMSRKCGWWFIGFPQLVHSLPLAVEAADHRVQLPVHRGPFVDVVVPPHGRQMAAVPPWPRVPGHLSCS